MFVYCPERPKSHRFRCNPNFTCHSTITFRYITTIDLSLPVLLIYWHAPVPILLNSLIESTAPILYTSSREDTPQDIGWLYKAQPCFPSRSGLPCSHRHSSMRRENGEVYLSSSSTCTYTCWDDNTHETAASRLSSR